jgi:hypothetical protein
VTPQWMIPSLSCLAGTSVNVSLSDIVITSVTLH